MIALVAKSQPAGPMVTGTYTVTSGTTFTWYDPGGLGGTTCPGSGVGNYADNLNITETITANPGQKIAVAFAPGTFGITLGDVLTIYDGPTNAFPVLASYTNTANPLPATIGPATNNSMTFVFTSDGSNNCKGWQATIAAYYFMQPGSYTFSCPGTYTFLDPQFPNSGGPGGDPTCPPNANSTKDYQDFSNLVETFFTNNGQCISVTPFLGSFGICDTDVLTVYNGPTIFSPIANGGAAVYTNTLVTPSAFSTTTNSVTYQFLSTGLNHARGWQINMSCVACPVASINNDCVNAIPLTPGSFCNYIPSSVSAGNSVQAGVPACVGNPNDDVWYTFVANNSTMSVTVAATDGTMDPVIQLLSGACISFSSLYCVNNTGAGGTETINATGLTIGTTYYIRVYDFTGNVAAHTFNICVVGSAPTDCAGAVQFCSTSSYNGTFNWNNYGVQEYAFNTFGCITGGETTSAWYYWQCQTAGTLSFNIASSNGTFQDVDWALWGNMNSMTCPMSAQPIRCSYAQGFPTNSYGLPAYSTGLQAAETDVSEGAGTCGGLCNAFVDTVHMKAGKYYALLLNLWGGNLNYQTTFNLSDGATFNTCVLPIELTSFDGENLGSQNWIYWTTASEMNNDHFVLQRSPDGSDFSDLAIIQASGNSNVEDKYDYYDKNPFAGINYYRLKQVDVDESYSYSEIISIGKSPGTDVVTSLSPNPTTGLINVGLTVEEDCNIVIDVFNEVGQLIQTSKKEMHRGENIFPVDLKACNRGIYTMRISACEIGKVFTKKIAKI